ncbi:uncharacterized protein HMPREF1541_02444 [Cyphellophora europaea CBS 101466]|uniref:Uncharacterized protein n=1 Tax=Cyphellophora europaea (strain CBS 101466) TaxID=1220924 RepID=W2S3V1_CYPE1|nr:uncharacterized protein HMPREF1541_02444 [Cyphellophora europaea CBS 101466]ETN43285.1 hypothetical protein HMPREF1541_02444 [Cyphellophora europaea CBS 101466]
MPDHRVGNVDHFTPTTHSSVPASLDPRQVKLPPSFTVCIIGASAGIGEYIAYAFARAGAKSIIIASRTVSDLQAVAARIRGINASVTVDVQQCDVASAASVAALAVAVTNLYGRLDAVIPNAAYAPPITGMKMTENSPELVQRAFDVNAMGTYHVAHYFVPLLLDSQNGAKLFLAVGSIAGCIRQGIIANTGYTISKMAQIRMVEYLGEQYGRAEDGGLLALAVHPGAVGTKMAEGNTPDAFLRYLTDGVDLCGAWLVWVASSRAKGELQWLTGRLVSANWDVGELLEKKAQIEKGDLLKFELLTR